MIFLNTNYPTVKCLIINKKVNIINNQKPSYSIKQSGSRIMMSQFDVYYLKCSAFRKMAKYYGLFNVGDF